MTASQPKWFTPLRLLGIFCLTNLVVYLDRGLIASNGVNGSPRTEENPSGTGIQGDFNLSYFADGLLPAIFMVGLLLSSPVFAEAVKHCSAFRMLGWGMAVWSAAVVACGAAPNFGCLLAARAFVGVGEASFVALAAPFIDDFAPAAQKTRWFAAFYLCIPVGFAAGYIFGGLVSAVTTWRWAFVCEGLAMVPFVVFVLTAQPLSLKGSEPAGARRVSAVGKREKGHHRSQHYDRRSWRDVVREFLADVATVCRQRVWVSVCIAYTAYVAVLGVYAYWGPKAGRALFFGADDSGGSADLVFGGVTVITGVVGSVAGGLALDKMGSTLRNANLLCGVSTLAGCCFLLLAFTTSRTFAAFMGVFALGQLVIFLLQAPVAATGMWCVPPELRPLGASLTTVSIHLLGDVPSPPLVGLLQTRLAAGKDPGQAAQQWRISLSVCTLLLLLSGGMFLLAAAQSGPGSDFRDQPPQPQQVGRAGEGGGGEEEGGEGCGSGIGRRGSGCGEGVRGVAVGVGGGEGEGGLDGRPLLGEREGRVSSSSRFSGVEDLSE
ncbi:hypothetical protein VOLCADRAFT_59957 [Volvox carteri f. nagariensis]|uniref:Major facilitator superfamily (MFS) profile domain-containing protein n=1 Tax=Volvox carteri f. nagariensis TaxID=3068 RepID=D8TTX4_VOLCA|nr:uncharacterized protein VOLCADRAFT_59957 [Volvox carteri f. nagariensis]EFJ49042.1 hypothetical protein VOLCADRAFT_59957 [Volvox carteri f. nagariensis]|eukprot:XP_002949939.1 hypothetical protein VOLCADRAFT_59957 [Volvox carteri f. nagariensis]